MNKCVFLDRDGVLNQDSPSYLYCVDELVITDDTIKALERLKSAGYLLIVVTNQAGIAKGLYKREDVMRCHEHLQERCGHLIDALYFCPHHPDYSSNSLLRKPDSLMLEKAIAKYHIDPTQSWMIGDQERDIQAGHKAGVRTIRIADPDTQSKAEALRTNLWEASALLVG